MAHGIMRAPAFPRIMIDVVVFFFLLGVFTRLGKSARTKPGRATCCWPSG